MQKKQELHKQFLIFVAHGQDEDRRYPVNAAAQGY